MPDDLTRPRRHVSLAIVALLLAVVGCSRPPTPFPDDSDFACADGRQLRLLVEEDWDRAILASNLETVTLLRGDARDGERWVARTGWEFRLDGEAGVLTSPGRPRTVCELTRAG